MIIPDKRGEKHAEVEPDDAAERDPQAGAVRRAEEVPAGPRLRRLHAGVREPGRGQGALRAQDGRDRLPERHDVGAGQPDGGQGPGEARDPGRRRHDAERDGDDGGLRAARHDLPRTVRPEQPLGDLAGPRASPASGQAALRPAGRVRDRRGLGPAARPQDQGRQGLLPDRTALGRADREPDGLVRGLPVQRAQERGAENDSGRAQGPAGRGLGGQRRHPVREVRRGAEARAAQDRGLRRQADRRGHGDLRQAEGPEGDADRDRHRREGGRRGSPRRAARSSSWPSGSERRRTRPASP